MYPCKKHHHAQNYALNRKRLEENFLEVNYLINDIRDYSISRKSIDPRAQTLGDAFTEIHGNRKLVDDSHELAWNNVIGDSVFNLTVKEYSEFDITWSVTAQIFEDFGTGLGVRVAPFVNDQILWGAADAWERRYKYLPGTHYTAGGGTPVPTDRTFPFEIPNVGCGSGATARHQDALHGSCSISVANGSFNIGLVAFSSQYEEECSLLFDRWYFLNPKIVARRISR